MWDLTSSVLQAQSTEATKLLQLCTQKTFFLHWRVDVLWETLTLWYPYLVVVGFCVRITANLDMIQRVPNVSLTWGSGFPLPCDDDVAKIPANAVKGWQHWPTKDVQVLMTSRTSTGQRCTECGGGWVSIYPQTFDDLQKGISSFRLSGGSIFRFHVIVLLGCNKKQPLRLRLRHDHDIHFPKISVPFGGLGKCNNVCQTKVLKAFEKDWCETNV